MPRMTFTNLSGSDIAVGNPSGYGKSFTIPVAGCVVDFSGVELESTEPQLQASKLAGKLTWVKSQNPNVPDDLEILSGSPSRTALVSVGPVAAKSANSVHASTQGDAVGPVTLTTGITAPVTPRNLRCVFGATWDGGAVTVAGTNQFDAAITEVFTGTNTTIVGVKAFKTVTSIAFPAGGTGTTGTNTLTVGTGDTIGLALDVVDTVGFVHVGTVIEAVTLNATYDTFVPTTTPSATTYIVLCNVNP
jgi:hypothetical protein